MNINEISEKEKSIILAKLIWREHKLTEGGSLFYDDAVSDYPIWTTYYHGDFYNPRNMATAWRVLNWATQQEGIHALLIDWDGCNWTSNSHLWALPPADAQRAWLDKILTLAIAAGMVTE